LRHYQQEAILAAERAIVAGQREMLLVMATGTGKTKTCIALIYRLLKAQRFRRMLFLVDRSALGEQAANAFKDTRMENLQTFADTARANLPASSCANWRWNSTRPDSPKPAWLPPGAK